MEPNNEAISPKNQNYLTLSNGCKLISISPQPQKPTSQSAASFSNPNSLCIFSKSFPQSLVFDLTRIHSKPQQFNVFGVFCSTVCASNPKIMEVLFSTDNRQFISAGLFSVRNRKGWQLAHILDVKASTVKFLKVTVNQNYGGQNTYIHELYLGGTSSPLEQQSHLRKKHGSEKHTDRSATIATGVDRIKHLQEKVDKLEGQNKVLNERVKQQNESICQLQQTIGIIVTNLQMLKNMFQGSSQQSVTATLSSVPCTPNRLKLDLQDLTQSPNRPQGLNMNSLITFQNRLQTHEQKKPYLVCETQMKKSQPVSSGEKSNEESLHNYRSRRAYGMEAQSQPNKYTRERSRSDKRQMASLLQQLQQKIIMKDKLMKKLRKERSRQTSKQKKPKQLAQYEYY